MKRKSGCRGFLWVGLLLLGSATLVLAQDTEGQNAPASDHTKMNQRDLNPNQATADQQPNNPTDRDITQQVRTSIVADIVADKDLLTYAHNVKVITQNGQVTLKGPVRSEDEKHAVEQKAAGVAGERKVTGELTVKTKS
jgi:osmotically-inducible protein OsmY